MPHSPQFGVEERPLASGPLADQVGRAEPFHWRGLDPKLVGANRPIVQPTKISKGIVSLVGRTSLDDSSNGDRRLLRPDVGDRARTPALNEFALDDPVGFSALAELARMALEEFRCHCGEAVQLAPLRRRPLASFFDLRVNPPADQLDPFSRLLAGLLEGDCAGVTERPPGRMLGV